MRFWLTVAMFAVLNVVAWFAYHQWFGSRLHVLQVEAFTPGEGGELSASLPSIDSPLSKDFVSQTESSSRLSFRFNLPMDTTGDVSRETPGRITPALAGVWRWDDARQLSFTPAQPPLGNSFTVTLDPAWLRARDGFRLASPFSATFHTPALKVIDARVWDATSGHTYVLGVDLTDVVAEADVASAITVVESDGTPVAVHQRVHHGRRVMLTTEPLGTRSGQSSGPITVRLTVKAGLRGRSGPLGLAQNQTFTLVLDQAVRLERVRPSTDIGDGDSELHLAFNRSLAVANLRQVLSIEPPVPFTIDESSESSSLTMRGAFKPAQRYSVVISAPPPGAKGMFPLTDRLPVWMPDITPKAWFPAGSGRLGSQGTRVLALKAVNLRTVTLRAWRMYDSNVLSWITRDGAQPWIEALGRPLLDRRLPIGEQKNHVHDVRLDLAHELPANELSDGVVMMEIDERSEDRLVDPADSNRWYRYDQRSPRSVVSLSDLALSCRRGVDGCTVWVTSLSTALPVADVRVRLFSSKQQLLGSAISGVDGLARLSEVVPPAGERAMVLLADTPAGALAWLALNTNDPLRDPLADIGGDTWNRGGLSAFVHAQRGVWRPGETVHLRAIVRDVTGQAPSPVPLRWRFRRPDWKIWREEVATTLTSGDVVCEVILPTDLPTGHWQVELTVPGDDKVLGKVSVQIEDFIPDRMTLSFRHSGPGMVAEVAEENNSAVQRHQAVIDGGPLTLHAQADYLFGRPVSGRPLKSWVRLDPTTWMPQGNEWEGWTFADTTDSASTLDHLIISGTRIDLPPAVADSEGRGTWALNIAEWCAERSQGRARPWRLQCGGEVTEVGGRAVSSSAQPVTLHPVRTWLGARLQTTASGTTLDLRLAGPTSVLTAGTANVRLYQEDWTSVLLREHGITRYQSTRVLTPHGAAVTLAVGLQGARWELPKDLPGGHYVVCAEWQDSRQMVSVFYRPTATAGWQESLNRERPDRCDVSVRAAPPTSVGDIVAGATDPAAPLVVGSEAVVTIRSPFPGRALLTVCTDRVVEARVVELTTNALDVRLPVTADWRPNAFVCVAVIRRVEPSAEFRLHRAFGVARVRTDESSRRLAVEFTASSTQLPGTTLAIAGIVRGADGAVVPGATVTVAAVDEGILRLTNYHTPDPFAWLIRPRALAVSAWDSYVDLLPELPRIGGVNPVGGSDGPALSLGRYQSPVSARRIVPLALWSGLLTADTEGRVHAEFPLPSAFSGRLRFMAVAASGANVGMAESWCTVRGALVVQSSWPRFVAPGDRFRVSAVVTNLSGKSGVVSAHVALPPDGLLTATTTDVQSAVANGAEVNLTFEVTAAARSGVAQVQVTAALRSEDALVASVVEAIELPVRPAAPRVTNGGEAVVTVATPWRGTIPGNSLPGNYLPGTGTIALRLGPRPTLSLPRGLDYLYQYPYGCAEQITSASFPLIHLRDIGEQIAPDLFAPAGITRRLDSGIARLQAMETDGGLAMWPGSRTDWPWATVYATHFLVAASRAGHAVPEDFLRRLLANCRRIDTYNEWRWAETQAYACYVLALAGQPAHALMQRVEELLKDARSEVEIGPSTRCWLSAAWMAAGRRDLAVGLLPQQLPSMRRDRRLDSDLASPIRDRAVMLMTLLEVSPDHAGIPGLAQDLAAAAPWQSTQDTSFALLALGGYLRVTAQSQPPTAVELLVDGANVVSTQPGPVISWNGVSASAVEARIQGDAQARGWLSWTSTGVPMTPPADIANGLTVRRFWSDELGNDLSGKVLISGDLVRVELLVTSDTAYRGVVLEDLLPAGLEIENPRLETTAAAQSRSDDGSYAERTEVRDDRLIIMGDLGKNADGKWVMRARYLARAVTPGTYTLPPVRAECMYDIAVNGIAGAGSVTVAPAR